MKEFLITIGFTVIFLSCSTDIEIYLPGKQIPVVYCLINPDSPEQYIRLEQTFTPDPNNPDLISTADSTILKQALDVYIEEWENGSLSNIFSFDQVFDPIKDSGFFPKENLRLYKSIFTAKRLLKYKLYVHFQDDGRILYGTTIIPPATTVYDPSDIPGRKLNFQSGVQYTIRWEPVRGANVYQGAFFINYMEDLQGDLSFHTVILSTEPIFIPSPKSEMTTVITSNHFFQEIIRQIPIKADVKRTMLNLQFRLFSGGEELGLQLSREIQNYSSFLGVNPYANILNGIGIFSSIQSRVVNNLELSNTTLRELANSDLTRNLGFSDLLGK